VRSRLHDSKKEYTLELVDLNEATREVIALSSVTFRKIASFFSLNLPTISAEHVINAATAMRTS